MVPPIFQFTVVLTIKFYRFNEEMMESLFGYASTERNNHNKKDSSSQSPPRFIQIIDAKKAQNLAILLKALNVTTEEVCDAIQEGSVCVPFPFPFLCVYSTW